MTEKTYNDIYCWRVSKCWHDVVSSPLSSLDVILGFVVRFPRVVYFAWKFTSPSKLHEHYLITPFDGNAVEFRLGNLYSNDEIHNTLGVGNAGGIRVNLDKENRPRRLIVMTTSANVRQASENPYHDRVEGDMLVYTGGGRQGDQSLGGVNKRIPQQLALNFPAYGFQSVRSRRTDPSDRKRWKFIGLLEFVRHYQDTQIDVRKQLRRVWLFEFRVHSEPSVVRPNDDLELSFQLLLNSRRNAPDEEDRELSISSIDGPDPIEIEARRSDLLALTPEKFEHVIKEVLVRGGFEGVAVTRFSQDGGIDVNATVGTSIWPIRRLEIQVQAKRWLHTVGRRDVAELRGSLQPFARGALVTTSHFSKAAISEATSPGKLPIVLVDGYSFSKITMTMGPISILV